MPIKTEGTTYKLNMICDLTFFFDRICDLTPNVKFIDKTVTKEER